MIKMGFEMLWKFGAKKAEDELSPVLLVYQCPSPNPRLLSLQISPTPNIYMVVYNFQDIEGCIICSKSADACSLCRLPLDLTVELSSSQVWRVPSPRKKQKKQKTSRFEYPQFSLSTEVPGTEYPWIMRDYTLFQEFLQQPYKY